jgi:hypothetical protein
MSYIGNPPVVQSSRLVYEETAATAKTAFTPPGGYTVGQLEVYINGAQLMSDDFSATDGSTVNLTTACAIGDGFKSIAYGNFLTTNALNKTGDTMTGPLTLGGLLNTGATGQIKFPATQNASADANTLDDYEEGTFTPVIGSSSGSITSQTGYGKYTKVGNVVTVTMTVAIVNVGTASGVMTINGMPFTMVSSGAGRACSAIIREDAYTGYAHLFVGSAGQTFGVAYTLSTNVSPPWTNGYQYTLSFSYFTN